MATVNMVSELPVAPRADALDSDAVAAWAASLPPKTAITGTTVRRGGQMHEYDAFGGLRATWTEERPDLPAGVITTGTVRFPIPQRDQ